MGKMPELKFTSESHHAIRKHFDVVVSLNDETLLYDKFMKLVNSSRKTLFVQHETVQDLLRLIDLEHHFDCLSSACKNELLKRYSAIKWHLEQLQKSMTSLIGHKAQTLESLEKIDIDAIIKNKGFVSLNARMGTGKTRYVCVPLCDKSRAQDLIPIVICHRVSLCDELSAITNTVSYRELTAKGAELTDARQRANKQGLTICLNSLNASPIQAYLKEHKDKLVVFIDEYQQTLSAIAGSHVKGELKTPILNALKSVIKNAQSLVVADADMNDYVLNIAKHIRGKQQPDIYFAERDISHKVINISLAHGKDTEPFDAATVQMQQHLDRGEKFVVYANRQRICVAVKKMITDNYPEKKTLLICGEGLGDTEQYKTFKRNAEEESQNYDVVIISPSITSGVSVINPEFKTAFCLYDGSSIAHFEAIQQMMRFRNVDNFHMVIGTQKKAGEHIRLSPKDYEQALAKSNYTVEEFNPHDGINRLDEHTKDNTHKSRAHFAQFMILRLKELGYTVHLDNAVPKPDILMYPLMEVTAEVGEQQLQNTLKAKDVSNAEYYVLKQREDELSSDDTYILKKHEIKAVLNIPQGTELTKEHLDFYAGGRGIPSLRRFCALFNFLDVHYAEDNEIEKNIPPVKRNFYLQGRDLISKLLEVIYGQKMTLSDLISMSCPAISNSQLEKAVQFIEENALTGVVTRVYPNHRLTTKYDKAKKGEPIHIPTPIDDKGRLKAIKAILEKVGIKIKSVGRAQARRQDGTRDDEHMYQPCFKAMMFMYELGLFQETKTKEIQEAIAKKTEALKASNQTEEKTFDELSPEERKAIEDIANGIRAEFEDGANRYRYSCPKCYTPTTAYVCPTCGYHEMENRVVDLRTKPKDELERAIFEARQK